MSKQYRVTLESNEGKILDEIFEMSPAAFQGYIVGINPYIGQDKITLKETNGQTLTDKDRINLVVAHELGIYNEMSIGSDDDFAEAVKQVLADPKFKSSYFIIEFNDGVMSGIQFEDPVFYNGYELAVNSMNRDDVIKNSRIYDRSGERLIRE